MRFDTEDLGMIVVFSFTQNNTNLAQKLVQVAGRGGLAAASLQTIQTSYPLPADGNNLR